MAFSNFLKRINPTKYIGITNHNLARKNLNETRGKSLVILVINNQARLIKIAIVIGCFRNRRSRLLLKRSLIKNNINMPRSNGSVGSDTPIPISKSRIFTASGVAKTTSQNTMSNEYRYIKTISIPIGIKAAQYKSLITK